MKSKLSEHLFKKGKFITPINSIPLMQELSDEKSWAYGRMPEYIWIGLILHTLGRNEGLNKLYKIILELHKLAPDLSTARLSQILKLESNIQKKFYEFIANEVGRDILAPLTVMATESDNPEFCESFFVVDLSIEERCNALTETMREIMGHQTHESTDIRFVALYYCLLKGKMHLPKEEIELIQGYPRLSHESELMRSARPSVRTLEMMTLNFEEPDSTYIQKFWRRISEMTECSIFTIEFPSERREIDEYMKKLHEVFVYLSNLYVATSPLEDKMNVLLGIATYSYKRLKEAYEHHLFNSISGRSCVRILIEDYIMMKYLVKNENAHENIWKDYKLYGLGLYKLVLAKHREFGTEGEPHFDQNYVEALVNEFKEEEFINIDTRYFDNQNIRAKAESVDEKHLYGLYYDYDSSFEHGLWGAIRESALLKCNNPAHQYHCIPDVDDENILKSVMPDCIMVMNKTLAFLNELYTLPKTLFQEVIGFEIKSFNGEDESNTN